MSGRNKNLWLGVGLSLLVPVLVLAGDVALPNTFTPGTAIKAAEVNDNFVALQAGVNAKLDATSATFVGTSRLSSYAYVSDGLRLPAGIYDNVLGAYCSPQLATDGTLRCLPRGVSATGYYSDPSCTELLYQSLGTAMGLPAETAAYFVEASAQGSQVWSAPLHTGTVYAVSGYTDGGALCAVQAAHPDLYARGQIVPPELMAQFTVQKL